MIPDKRPLIETDIAPRPLSRLSYQIMGLNLMAVLILIAGVFYLDKYKRDLTTAETEILATEAQLYASLLTDNAVNEGEIDVSNAEKLLTTFGAQKTQRLRLFASSGKLLLDTKTPDRAPEKTLPEFLGKTSEDIFAFLTGLFSITFELPLYPDVIDTDMKSFPDTVDASEGNLSLSAWQSKNGGLILSTAVPVSKNGHILGVILVTRADTKIERTFSAMRISVIKFFLGALFITLFFSLYLSAAIGHPLRKLAAAAKAVQEGRAGTKIIPDFSYRKDEIGELSIALREMAGALQERIDTIEKFAADVSHELKNPLTSMRSAIETLDKVQKEEDRKKLIGIVLHDLLRTDRLISDISRASRLDVELLRDVLAPTDLRQVILPLVDAYQKPLERDANSGTLPNSIECSGLSDKVMVLGQVARLSQVFQNLIGNALSFSPANTPITISVRQGPEFVNIIVDDNGPGIPENRLEKIFERFYTERPNTEAFGSHSGLGLSIARQIIDAHDGTIIAQNRTDDNGKISGARFIVRLRPA